MLSLVLLWLPCLIGISATQQTRTWQCICVFSFAWVHLVTNICTVLGSVGVSEGVISFCSLVFKGCNRKESILISLRAVQTTNIFVCSAILLIVLALSFQIQLPRNLFILDDFAAHNYTWHEDGCTSYLSMCSMSKYILNIAVDTMSQPPIKVGSLRSWLQSVLNLKGLVHIFSSVS